MIGVSEMPQTSNGGRVGGYRLRSVDHSAGAIDSRRASCWAVSEVLNQQMSSRVAEHEGSYILSKGINLPEVVEKDSLDKNISELGVWITYLEEKYALTS